MAEKQTPSGHVDSATGPTRAAPRTFNQWLQTQLKTRKLTQRQLAQKSGVDHSTISRLTREDRVPSLHTATLLARGLGMSQDPGTLDAEGFGERGSPGARVEYALRSDDLLSEADIHQIMNVYLAARLHSPRHDAAPAVAGATSRTPVPIVVEVPGMRSRSASSRRPPNATRGRSR
jgi:transcriptional regulator with XRE-family HTH domain